MLESEFEKLSSSPLPKSKIDFIFCNRMLRRGACYLKLDSNCIRCLPILQALITRTNSSARNKEALLTHLLAAYGDGEESWESAEKKAIQQSIFYEADKNIFRKLIETL
jgi:hypothetical protein